jgi:hypothetical protein
MRFDARRVAWKAVGCILYGRLSVSWGFAVMPTLSSRFSSLPVSPSTALPEASSAKTLRDMLVEIEKRKTKGSDGYQRAWRHWSGLCTATIRHHLSHTLAVPANAAGFTDLWFSLGIAADTGDQPTFECAGSRSGYALEFFCRAQLLANLLLDVSDNPSLPAYWRTEAKTPLQSPLQEGTNGTCRLLSIGGGPGYDFVAAALVASFAGTGAAMPVTVEAAIFDYEAGWNDVVDSMAVATAAALPTQAHTCRWGGPCDITKSLSDPCNAACWEAATTSNLFVCQYVVAENANGLRASDFVFFRDLFQAAPVGATFVFTETNPRLWPDFVALLAADMQLGFVRNTRTGKTGPHMILRKMATASTTSAATATVALPADQQALCDNFVRLRELHERKMRHTPERQKPKVPGAKE